MREGSTFSGIGREERLPLRVIRQWGFLPEMAGSTQGLIKSGSSGTWGTRGGAYDTMVGRSFRGSDAAFAPSMSGGVEN